MARFDPTDLAQLEQHHEFRAALFQRTHIVTAPDGIKALGLPSRLSFALKDADLLTIASVQRRVVDDSIGDVPRIGKVREKALREALASWGQEHTAEKALDELDREDEDEDDDEGGEA